MLLYQFALSHYCEKVRWALDYKGLEFKVCNLVPGPHLFQTKGLAPRTCLPILVDGKNIIQDSTSIIDYLDRRHPKQSLTPSTPNTREETLELEEYFDKEAGVHLRRFFYFHILQHRKLATSLLLRDSSRSARVTYFFLFPVVRSLMRKSMKIYPEPVQASAKRLRDVLEFLNRRVAKQAFLVGNAFSRADLSAAALLAPLCQPPEHDFTWPREQTMPPALREFRQEHQNQPFFQWVLTQYRDWRRRDNSTDLHPTIKD